MSELPIRVGVWRKLTTGWGKVGELETWETLACEPRFRAPGVWSLRAPYTEQTLKLTVDRLVTIDLNGRRLMTGMVTSHVPHSDPESGEPFLEVSGVDVLAMLGWVTCWPNPLSAITAQTATDYVVSGPTESVLRRLVMVNAANRRGMGITVPPSQARGASVTVRARFDNLAELMAKYGKKGGLGYRMGLVESSGTRAALTVTFFLPADRTKRVRLSHRVGSLASWTSTSDAPTVTYAIVGGAGTGVDRVMAEVRDDVASAAWGGHREVFIDARDTFDVPELTARGELALEEGVGAQAFTLEAADAEGMQFGVHYDLGDSVLVELLTGATTTDAVSSARLSAGADGYSLTPVVGDPDGDNPDLRQAQVLRAVARRVRALEQRR